MNEWNDNDGPIPGDHREQVLVSLVLLLLLHHHPPSAYEGKDLDPFIGGEGEIERKRPLGRGREDERTTTRECGGQVLTGDEDGRRVWRRPDGRRLGVGGKAPMMPGASHTGAGGGPMRKKHISI